MKFFLYCLIPIPQNVPQNVPQYVPQNVPQFSPQIVSQYAPRNIFQNIPQYVPQKIFQNGLQNVPQNSNFNRQLNTAPTMSSEEDDDTQFLFGAVNTALHGQNQISPPVYQAKKGTYIWWIKIIVMMRHTI